MIAVDPAAIPAALRCAHDPALARIEDAGLSASQPREQAFYDGWLLRYARGKAKRARSVNLVGAGTRPLAEKLAHCAAFYARQGVPFILRITPFSQPAGVDDALARAGFVAGQDTRVMVAALDQYSAGATPADSATPVAVDVTTFAEAFAALHGLDPQRAAVERERFARSACAVQYLAVRDGDRTVACGSAAVDGDLVGLFGLVTAASHRGRGLAARIVAALLARAREHGCTRAYLQVEAANTAARRAYAKFGFVDAYAYWYRFASADAEIAT